MSGKIITYRAVRISGATSVQRFQSGHGYNAHWVFQTGPDARPEATTAVTRGNLATVCLEM